MHELRRFAALIVVMVAATACQEDLRGGAACPGLCPEQAIDMRDTVIFPVVLDTTLIGYPPAGSELTMLLSHRPDTVRSAVVVRFDRVPTEFIGPGDAGNQPVISFDSLALVLTLSTLTELEAPATIQVFDVDTLAADLNLDAVRATFRPDRLLASFEYEVGDTIPALLSLTLPHEVLNDRLLDGERLRLGVRLEATESVDLRVLASGTGSGPSLAVRPLTPAGHTDATVAPNSHTPPEQGPAIPEMADFTLVLEGSPPPPPNTLVIGGLPGRRVFLRFELPVGLAETTTVVRASLLLTQIPNTRAGPTDTVTVVPRPVLASPRLDPGVAALLVADPAAFGLPIQRTRPDHEGVIAIDIAGLVRQWRALDTTIAQRSLVLQASDEGLTPHEIHFHSTEAPDPADRPRLRLTYVPRSRFGLP